MPNKIYKDLNGAPLLYHTIARAKEAKFLDNVVVASPDPLPDLPEDTKEFVYGGDEMDVLGRYAACLRSNPCDYVVRLTSDCPLLDPNLIDYVISHSIGYDYGSNVLISTFPDGLDVEIVSSSVIKWMNDQDISKSDREHVTTYIRNNRNVQSQLNLLSIESIKDYSYMHLSVNTEEDLKRVREFEANV